MESRLSDREDFVDNVENKVLVVPVLEIANLVKNHFNGYAGRLLDSNEMELRKKFIKKMILVCRK